MIENVHKVSLCTAEPRQHLTSIHRNLLGIRISAQSSDSVRQTQMLNGLDAHYVQTPLRPCSAGLKSRLGIRSSLALLLSSFRSIVCGKKIVDMRIKVWGVRRRPFFRMEPWVRKLSVLLTTSCSDGKSCSV